ncbi:hypothetical protein [Jannaschia pohangensis]|uniref:hypothetical protein n=1 Tax=Jannaschia pohangensis TaxID=390807 RepID=UPI001113D504|nr:hypothetical protein [Jannaschia pohangensis]
MYISLALVAALASCQSVATPAAEAVSGLTLVPASDGLDVVGSGGRQIGFGRDIAGVLESVARVEGRPPRAVDCAPGMQAFATRDSVRLNFSGGKFVGWDTVAASAGRTCA